MVHHVTNPPTPADSLAVALIVASHAQVLLLDGSLHIIASSGSFDRAYSFDTGGTRGRLLGQLGVGEWAGPQLQSLLTATLSGFADVVDYEMELRSRHGVRQLVLNATKVPGVNSFDAQLLLTVLDVTAARLADKQRDDLVREKDVLLREVQHRVANSLQIIASVLMQSARRVQSEETRTALASAHSRVISIAEVQRQLADSTLQDVDLKAYLVQLCKSLGASMISDGSVSLVVTAQQQMVPHDVSIRIGLIVTELVINALKHAFPDQREGTVTVSFAAIGSEWTLGVVDNGVGMPKDGQPAVPGLGTSIVEALAKQLGADVVVADQAPGTSVSIIHTDAGQGAAKDVWVV